MSVSFSVPQRQTRQRGAVPILKSAENLQRIYSFYSDARMRPHEDVIMDKAIERSCYYLPYLESKAPPVLDLHSD